MILVVDDFPDAAEALVGLLRKAGREATAIDCGEALFEQLERIRPSLIVLDMAMPGMSGIECLEKLSAEERWRDIPVVVYSADFTYTKMQDALKAGAREFLVKGTVAWSNLVGILQKYDADA